METTAKRISWIDTAKGIGISFVVLGHYIQTLYVRSGGGEFAFYWIYSFHMPLFFFLSGLVYKHKKWNDFLQGLLKNLLIPTIVFSILYFLYKALIIKENIDWWGIIVCDRHSYMHLYWFMWSLFWTKLLYYIIHSFIQSPKIILGLSIVVLYVCFFLKLNEFLIRMPLCLGNVPYVFVFYAVGVVIHNYKIVKVKVFVPFIMLGLSLLACVLRPASISYALLSFDFAPIDYVKAFLGIFFICIIAQVLEPRITRDIIKKIGQESMYVYLIHGFFFWGIYKRVLDYILDNSLLVWVYTVLFTITTIIIIHMLLNGLKRVKEKLYAT